MYKLKLIKGRSYTGRGVKATASNPVIEVETKEISDSLLASGYFSFVGEAVPANSASSVSDKPLTKMTEKELEAYAEENGIDLTGLSKKADKLAAIQQALEAGELFDDED
uniref:HeH/LEM domain protein n=1 Tax=Dulem virus 37 TaxID=3145755 RepID=A0AAU8AXD7_9CAUD